MDKLFSVIEVARLIASAEGWGKPAEDRLHRQVKHWRASNILPPKVDSADGRGTALFDATAVCKARLFVALADIGLDVDDIDSAMRGIAPPATHVESSRDDAGNWVKEYRWDDGEDRHWHIDVLLSRVSPNSAEKYFCAITILRDVIGGKVISGHLYSNEDPRETPESEAASKRFRDFQSLKVQARVSIPLTDILAHTLQALRLA